MSWLIGTVGSWLAPAAAKIAPWRGLLIAAGVAAVALVIGWLWLRLDAATARADLEASKRQVLEAAQIETLQALDDVRADARRVETALTAEIAETRRRANRYATIREEARHAADANPEGCVGPAVRRALDGLRRQ